MCVLSSVLFLVPWTTSKWSNVTVYGVIGGTVAILMIGKILFHLQKPRVNFMNILHKAFTFMDQNFLLIFLSAIVIV
jgi:hypothetical protein